MLTSKHFLRGSGTKIHKYSSSKGQIQTKKELNTVYLLKAKRTANSVNKKALSTRQSRRSRFQTNANFDFFLTCRNFYLSCLLSLESKNKNQSWLSTKNCVNLNMWRNSCGGDRETENRLDFWQKSYSCNLSDSADEILPNTNTNTNT